MSDQSTAVVLLDMDDSLVHHILPRLSARDLAALTCTCTALRQLLGDSHEAWCKAAAAVLPCSYPSKQLVDHCAVQAALRVHHLAQRNISAGRLTLVQY